MVVLIRRYALSRRDEERLESEMEAARTVQKAHISDETPDLPFFQVQAVYKPASHVGGDFFQIIPIGSGATLIVIGDVSGKGMPAAMTVALLVGTFRTLAHFLCRPAEILQAMNERVLARGNGGFTTCLVLRADPDGTLTIANAGHIPPYLEGREVPVANGLPLGIVEGVDYSEIALQLEPGAQLTLLTDGVVEAQSVNRELFGFDRTRQISTQSAEAIARAAQAYGQEDDITVLTLQYQGKSCLEGSLAGLELEGLTADG
jgi:serine phosphatase RsbU (regulator of sigma subunit)